MDFSTKLGPYNRNYFEAPGPQHKQHPIGNNIQTEDLVPQQSPWLLLPEILVEILTYRTKLPSPRRKNRGLNSWLQDYPVIQTFMIKILADITNLVSD